jgi:siderophore synthetase component
MIDVRSLRTLKAHLTCSAIYQAALAGILAFLACAHLILEVALWASLSTVITEKKELLETSLE